MNGPILATGLALILEANAISAISSTYSNYLRAIPVIFGAYSDCLR